jgi:hypothetical protein
LVLFKFCFALFRILTATCLQEANCVDAAQCVAPDLEFPTAYVCDKETGICTPQDTPLHSKTHAY